MKKSPFFENMVSFIIHVLLLFLASFTIVNNSFAADLGNISVATMIQNFAASIPNLMRLTTAVAYVLGMYFVINGILLLKKYGEQRTQLSSENSLKGPLIFIAAGAGLLYLPTSIQQGFTTFWTNPSPYAYQTSDAAGPFSDFINACFLIVQLIGAIYFIKGLSMMTHLSANSQQGFGRALTHVIGGIFCIDFYDFINMILQTLGLGQI